MRDANHADINRICARENISGEALMALLRSGDRQTQ